MTIAVGQAVCRVAESKVNCWRRKYVEIKAGNKCPVGLGGRGLVWGEIEFLYWLRSGKVSYYCNLKTVSIRVRPSMRFSYHLHSLLCRASIILGSRVALCVSQSWRDTISISPYRDICEGGDKGCFMTRNLYRNRFIVRVPFGFDIEVIPEGSPVKLIPREGL